jgi:hypothetical protein
MLCTNWHQGKCTVKPKLSTFMTHNGTFTADIGSTMNHMMDHFIPEDNESNDSAHHKLNRQLAAEPLDTLDDEEFTKARKVRPGQSTGRGRTEQGHTTEDFQALSHLLHRVIHRVLKERILP